MQKHLEIIIRSEIGKPPTEDDLDKMNFWFRDLIDSIGMKILSGPHTVYCNKEGNRGYTGVCAIETSHLALHSWDEETPYILQLDLYTCSDLDVSIVIEKLMQFEPKKIHYMLIDKENKLELLEEKTIVL